MDEFWVNMLQKYGQIINEAHIAKLSNMQPNLAAYHHAVGMLEGYALACHDAGIATDEEYQVMIQQIKTFESGGML